MVVERLIESLEPVLVEGKELENVKRAWNNRKNRTSMVIGEYIYSKNKEGQFQKQKTMFWHNPYMQMSYNYVNGKPYNGVNVLLLEGGEYITMNMLKALNEKYGTDYMVMKGTRSKMVVYADTVNKPADEKAIAELTEQDKADLKAKYTIVKKGVTYKLINDVICTTYTFWKYTNVFNIGSIKNSKGEFLKPHKVRGKESPEEVKQRVLNNMDIVNAYLEKEKIALYSDGAKSAYYSSSDHSIHMVPAEHLSVMGLYSDEVYMRALLHECVHSTSKTLGRKLAPKFDKEEYGLEELIAELGSFFLSLQMGLTMSDEVVEDVLAYTNHWGFWLKDNKNQIFYAITQAQKACDYIMGVSNEKASDKKEAKSSTKQVQAMKQKYNVIYTTKLKNKGIVIWEVKGDTVVSSVFANGVYGRKCQSKLKKVKNKAGKEVLCFMRKGKDYAVANAVTDELVLVSALESNMAQID